MKFVLHDLKVGDQLHGRVEELLDSHELLINFDGDLLRVANETRKPFRVGDSVTLLVRAIAPLRFQLSERRRGRLDVNV